MQDSLIGKTVRLYGTLDTPVSILFREARIVEMTGGCVRFEPSKNTDNHENLDMAALYIPIAQYAFLMVIEDVEEKSAAGAVG